MSLRRKSITRSKNRRGARVRSGGDSLRLQLERLESRSMLATWSTRVDFPTISGISPRSPSLGIEIVLDSRVVALPNDVPLPATVYVLANPIEFWDGFYVNGGGSHGANEEYPWEVVDSRFITVDLVDGNGGSVGGWVELSLTYTPIPGAGDPIDDTGAEGDTCGACNESQPSSGDGKLRFSDGPAAAVGPQGMASDVALEWDASRPVTDGVSPPLGPGWSRTSTPSLSMHAPNEGGKPLLAVSFGNDDVRVFKDNGTGSTIQYGRAHGLGSTDTLTASGGQFTFRTAGGSTYLFEGFGGNVPAAKRGKLISQTDAAGNSLTYTFDPTTGNTLSLTSRLFGQAAALEIQEYTYTAGKVSRIDIKRANGTLVGPLVRWVEFGYSTGGHSPAGTLTSVTVRDAANQVLDTRRYRYYSTTLNGVPLLKYTFDPESVRRANTALVNWATLNDDDVKPYATNYYEYDAQGRVTLQKSQGTGCSACTAGIGQYTYSYAQYTGAARDPNRDWKTKVTETRPDLTQRVVYSNVRKQPILEVISTDNGTKLYGTYIRYDARGQAVWKASPEAVILPTNFANLATIEGYPDLMNENLANGTFDGIRDSVGLIDVTNYATTTTATATSPGTVDRFVKDTGIKLGELGNAAAGTAFTQAAFTYYTQTSSTNSNFVVLVATSTTYPTSPTPTNTNPVDAQTTNHSYTFASNSTRVTGQLTTLPVVSTTQNGPGGSGAQIDRRFDAAGREIWLKDAGGFFHYTEYDTQAVAPTGAVVKTITDVNPSATPLDFQNFPAAWPTTAPSDGGTHLKTQYEVDGLGRVVKLTDPEGNVTHTVYKDAARETRIYRGWNTGTTTGPIEVYRRDTTGTYVETMTYFSQAIAVDAQGRPTGGEAYTYLQSLTRSHMNNAGQVIAVDRYSNLNNVTHDIGFMAGALRTTYGHDNKGQIDRVVTPAGTITFYIYDGLKRLTGVWVGTNDTSSTGWKWTPSTPGPGSNMVQVAAYDYDTDKPLTVGNSNLTRVTEYPQGNQPLRVTEARYDWRNRVVAVKEGSASGGYEDPSVNRPFTSLEYDNLDRVTSTKVYDGDSVAIVSVPAASLLRESTTSLYDSYDRVYREEEFFVDQGTGAVATNKLTTDIFYDKRGNVAAVYAPTSPVTQARYDGAGRLIASYVLGNIPTANWTNATSLTSSLVVEQTEYGYDLASNQISTTNRRRFHDVSATLGALGTPTSGILARVTYTASYFDKANRITASVDVGTNGGAVYTRPATVPNRSDNDLVTSYGYDAAGNLMDITDPKGITTRTGRDHMGRTVNTILNLTGDGLTAGAQTNVRTTFVWDSVGRLAQRIARQPAGTPDQSTTYEYGVSSSSFSDIASNDIVSRTLHPDPSNGVSSTTEADTYRVNALGERKRFTDRAGTVHDYSYDVMGRLRGDSVTAFGAGVDTAVQSLDYRYDTLGRMTLASSLTSTNGVINQVARSYSGFGQLINEWQAHTGGAVAGVTPAVNYVYTNTNGGTGNHSRRITVNYPSLYALNYIFTGPVDSAMSRPSHLSGLRANDATAVTLEAFKYLGASTVVERSRPEIDTTFTLVPGTTAGAAGDKYTGLDRFDRVVVQRWANGPGGSGAIVAQHAYSYDPNGNRLSDSIYSTTYSYDALNQVQSFSRAAFAPGVTSQQFSPDALGNWTSVTSNGVTQNRTANAQNEVTIVGHPNPSGAYSPVGNMLVDVDGRTLRYDAWNRLVTVSNSSNTTLARYTYDALNRRVTEQVGTAAAPNADSQPIRDLYYSDQWQVLEERVRSLATPGIVASTADTRFIWSPVYVDALIARDRNADGTAGLEERIYALQDANWNTTAIVAASGVQGFPTTGQVIYRFIYSPFGTHEVLNAAWGSVPSPTIPWSHLFQGLENTDATKLYHMRNRDYSASLGRFIQRDPIGFAAGDNNVYRFVGNGPTGNTDPSGLEKGKKPSRRPIELDFSEDEGLPRAPEGIQYALPDLFENTVVADGKGGLRAQVNPGHCKDFKNQDKILQITCDHEQIHISDLQAVNPTPGIDADGRPVPDGFRVQFDSFAKKGASEVKATTDSLEKLREIRKNEKDVDERKRLDGYIEQLEAYRRQNQKLVDAKR